MADNPVTFPRRFFPARPAPQREIGAGLDLTLRLSKTAKAQQPCCEPEASWVGVDVVLAYETTPPIYLGADGNTVEWSTRPIQTLTIEVGIDPYLGNSDHFVFAAVSGTCETVEWTMTGDLTPDCLRPMGVACFLRFFAGSTPISADVTLTPNVNGVDLAPLVLHVLSQSTGGTDPLPVLE